MIFLGFPLWGVFWGIGMVGHLMGVSDALRVWWRAAPQPSVPDALPAPELKGFAAELHKVLGDLEAQGESVEALRDEALALHARRVALDRAFEGADLDALRAERDEALARAAEAAHDTDREVFE